MLLSLGDSPLVPDHRLVRRATERPCSPSQLEMTLRWDVISEPAEGFEESRFSDRPPFAQPWKIAGGIDFDVPPLGPKSSGASAGVPLTLGNGAPTSPNQRSLVQLLIIRGYLSIYLSFLTHTRYGIMLCFCLRKVRAEQSFPIKYRAGEILCPGRLWLRDLV